MGNYLSPGIYTEDVPPSVKSITGVETSIAGFIGKCYNVFAAGENLIEAGNTPVRLTNWKQFIQKFGDFQEGNNNLAHGVYGFFNNGGTVCWVVRVVKEGEEALYTAIQDTLAKDRKWQQTEEEYLTLQDYQISLTEYGDKAVEKAESIRTKTGNNNNTDTLLFEKNRIVNFITDAVSVEEKTEKIGAIDQVRKSMQNFRSIITDISITAEKFFINTGDAETLIQKILNISQNEVIKEELSSLGETLPCIDCTIANELVNSAIEKTNQGFLELARIPELSGESLDTDFDEAIVFLQNAAEYITDAATDIQNSLLEILKVVDLNSDAEQTTFPQALTAGINLTGTITDIMEQEASNSLAEFDAAKSSYESTRSILDDTPYTLDNYVNALDRFKNIDEIAIIAAPGVTDKTVQEKIFSHCETLGDRFAILDGQRLNKGENFIPANVSAGLRNAIDGAGAIYFPWIKVYDPFTGKTVFIPPSGHIAGVYARSDENRGVHKTPANEIIRGALGVEHNVRRADQDVLNPEGINVIRNFNGNITLWGARTFADKMVDGQWIYISTRRLLNYIKKSIEEGTRWTLFEPNTSGLWQKIIRSASAFLTAVWRSGGLAGNTPEEAFYVKCDKELNPPSVRDLGQVIIEVGAAVSKPAEFVIFKISQWKTE